MQKEEVTLQTLAENRDIQIGYSDKDIVYIDSIQKFAEIGAAHVAMSAIVMCTSGKVQGLMNGQHIELCKNQVAVIPPNVTISDLMISPDFDIKAMFLTNTIMQSFLQEKMSVWNEMMYIHKFHILTLDGDEDMLFYTHFYEMFRLCIDKGKEKPFTTDVIQSLLRSAVLGLCGIMKEKLPTGEVTHGPGAVSSHFQNFLQLLDATEVKHRTVEYYANQLCISPKYLTVICKKNSGKSAMEWITEHVIEDIRYYLKQTDLSIKQISDRLGFPNPSFFGKYVKEHFGCSPMEYRKGSQ